MRNREKPYLGFMYHTSSGLGGLSWGRKRSHGGLSGRPHNLILSVKPVMAQLGHPGIKNVLRFDLKRKRTEICLSSGHLKVKIPIITFPTGVTFRW